MCEEDNFWEELFIVNNANSGVCLEYEDILFKLFLLGMNRRESKKLTTLFTNAEYCLVHELKVCV